MPSFNEFVKDTFGSDSIFKGSDKAVREGLRDIGDTLSNNANWIIPALGFTSLGPLGALAGLGLTGGLGGLSTSGLGGSQKTKGTSNTQTESTSGQKSVQDAYQKAVTDTWLNNLLNTAQQNWLNSQQQTAQQNQQQTGQQTQQQTGQQTQQQQQQRYQLPTATPLQAYGENSLYNMLYGYNPSGQNQLASQTNNIMSNLLTSGVNPTPEQKALIQGQTAQGMTQLQQYLDDAKRRGLSEISDMMARRGISGGDIYQGANSNVVAQYLKSLGEGYNQLKQAENAAMLQYPMQNLQLVSGLNQQYNNPLMQMLYQTGMSRLTGPRDVVGTQAGSLTGQLLGSQTGQQYGTQTGTTTGSQYGREIGTQQQQQTGQTTGTTTGKTTTDQTGWNKGTSATQSTGKQSATPGIQDWMEILTSPLKMFS